MSGLTTAANAKINALLLSEDKKEQVRQLIQTEFDDRTIPMQVQLVGNQLTMTLRKTESRNVTIDTSQDILDISIDVVE